MQTQMPGGNGHLDGELRLNQIVYLGAHNCAMAKCYGWLYVQQNVTITEQFIKYGARHFKVPIHWHVENNIPQIVIAHEGDGGANCKLSVIQRGLKDPERALTRLKEIVNLAFQYPNEIIILKLESKLMCNTKKNCTEGWDPQLIGIMLHSLLVELRADQRALYFEGNIVPTLQYCREHQKNLIITIEPKSQMVGDLTKYTHFSYLISGQVNWEEDPLKEVTSGKIQRGTFNNDGSLWSPFLEIHLNPENSFRPDSSYKQKYNQYSHVRKRILSFNNLCNKMPNFVVADFVDCGNLSQIIDDMNAIINTNGKFLPELFAVL